MEAKQRRVSPEAESAEVRLQRGLSLILSALPELLFRWLASRRK